MRVWFLMFLVLLGLASWSCARTCETGETKVGDRCVALLDAASELGDGGLEPEPEDDGGDISLDGAAQVPGAASDTGVVVSDSGDTGEEAGGADDAASGSPDSSGDSGGECSGATCLVDACHPNPCAHGSCSLVPGGSFSCQCEPDWRGNSTCTANTNATLSGLTVSAGKLYPAFKSSLHQYSVDLPLGATEVTLTPVAAQPQGVVLRVDGEPQTSGQATPILQVTLNEPRRVLFSATADNGDVKTYEVTLRRTLKVQAVVADSPAASDSFGLVLAMNGNQLAVSNRAGSETILDYYARGADGRWSYVSNGPGEPTVLDIGDRWSVVGGPGNVVRIFDQNRIFASGSGLALPHDPAVQGFGRAVAVHGNSVAVLSSSFLHFYEVPDLENIREETFSLHNADYVAMNGELLVTSKQGTGTPHLDPESATVRVRAGASWASPERPDQGSPYLTGGRVGVGDGRVYIADFYGCIISCAGNAPTLNVFERVNDQWVRFLVTLPTAPSVPGGSHPMMFGQSMAAGPDFVVVGAPWVMGLQPGVVRAGDPKAPAPIGGEDTIFYGLAYLFVKRGGTWQLDATLGPAHGETPDKQPVIFGAAMDYSHGRIAISAPTIGVDNAAAGTPSPGAGGVVYVFGPDCSAVPQGADVLGC